MSEFTVEEMQHAKGAKIKIIGCGGGGGNMINHMMNMGLNNLDLIVANTDGQALTKSLAKTKIQLGEKTTRGLGAGGDPDVGAESAKENFEEIKAALDQSDIVFIASGFGGGTGTGATPIVARAAKEVGALTVSVITMPFAFEGAKKKKFAETGLAELKKESDSILVIQNEKVKNLIDKKASAREVYALIDDVLARAVKGMVSILLDNGRVNVDFADIKTIMSHRGLALMGMGSAQGENAAMEALANALESPLLDGLNVKNAKGLILNFKHHPSFSFLQIDGAAQSLAESLGSDVSYKYGYYEDESMEEDMVEVTIIATGFEYQDQHGKIDPAATNKESENKKTPYVGLGMTGTFNNDEIITHLEVPTWIRKQMD
ncbi:cell division protein FtsZ [Campylobacter sp. MIT 97-5078]|uniref:cell division protein FtsZ n=1 Tax=Campylobacter sp. MIT 97-5078 TaxID=1548153 RepID=UPI00051459F6|nr:cell division protein FtsZ [Campylobacter sp. MIT 97-5078]KGI56477.1 cell division protein FtsZ [Campylobacter sp. MIT 97-5078]TQR28002.1 cell division protein FtsZ [Campylobacter sp. MIT 97-5078]